MLLIVCALFMMISAVIMPNVCVQSATNGLQLSLNTVIPSLFPFFIASSILVKTGAISKASRIISPAMESLFRCPGETGYIFAMSLVSGYPTGAKLTAYYMDEGVLSLSAAKRTLALCSTAGPAFMLGAVAIMLGSTNAGWMIALSHYFSALLCGMIARFRYPDQNIGSQIQQKKVFVSFKAQPAGQIISGAVWDAAKSLVMVSGLIIFFSVLTGVLSSIGILRMIGELFSPVLKVLGISTELSQSLAVGGMEMVTGCKLAASTSCDIAQKTILISGIIAWGGLSVHAQALSFFKVKGITAAYFSSKALQAMIAMILCTILVSIFPLEQTVLQQSNSQSSQVLLISLFCLGVGIIVLALLAIFCKLVMKK